LQAPKAPPPIPFGDLPLGRRIAALLESTSGGDTFLGARLLHLLLKYSGCRTEEQKVAFLVLAATDTRLDLVELAVSVGSPAAAAAIIEELKKAGQAKMGSGEEDGSSEQCSSEQSSSEQSSSEQDEGEQSSGEQDEDEQDEDEQDEAVNGTGAAASCSEITKEVAATIKETALNMAWHRFPDTTGRIEKYAGARVLDVRPYTTKSNNGGLRHSIAFFKLGEHTESGKRRNRDKDRGYAALNLRDMDFSDKEALLRPSAHTPFYAAVVGELYEVLGNAKAQVFFTKMEDPNMRDFVVADPEGSTLLSFQAETDEGALDFQLHVPGGAEKLQLFFNLVDRANGKVDAKDLFLRAQTATPTMPAAMTEALGALKARLGAGGEDSPLAGNVGSLQLNVSVDLDKVLAQKEVKKVNDADFWVHFRCCLLALEAVLVKYGRAALLASWGGALPARRQEEPETALPVLPVLPGLMARPPVVEGLAELLAQSAMPEGQPETLATLLAGDTPRAVLEKPELLPPVAGDTQSKLAHLQQLRSMLLQQLMQVEKDVVQEEQLAQQPKKRRTEAVLPRVTMARKDVEAATSLPVRAVEADVEVPWNVRALTKIKSVTMTGMRVESEKLLARAALQGVFPQAR